MKNRIISMVLVLAMMMSLAVPVYAGPSSNAATRESLETMVRGYVEDNYDKDSVVSNIEDYIAGLVTDAVMATLANSSDLLAIASPYLSTIINELINKTLQDNGLNISDVDVSSILESVLNSGIIDEILSIKIVADILDRTIEYAVKDALEQYLGIGGEKANADIEVLVEKYTDEIFGLSFPIYLAKPELVRSFPNDSVNPFHTISSSGNIITGYKYSITGWQNDLNAPIKDISSFIPSVAQLLGQYTTMESYIAARLAIDSAIDTGGNILNFDMTEFQNALPDLIWKAMQRAAKDVVTEKINEINAELERIVKEEIAKLKEKTAAELNKAFGEIGLDTNIQDSDIPYGIKGKIVSAVKDSAVAEKEEAIAKLEAFKESAIARLLGLQKDIEEAIREIRDDAKAAKLFAKETLVSELNGIFGTNLTTDMDWDDIEAALSPVINKLAIENQSEIISKLRAIKSASDFATKYTCLDLTHVSNFIEKLIACIEKNVKAKPIGMTTTTKDFISITETSKNSRLWVLSFYVTVTYSDGTTERVEFQISLSGNNANLDGKYTFNGDHDLAGYTLTYDIKGNGSNIKELKLTK